MLNVYGIPNCDSVKKLVRQLKEKNISYKFHDFKISPVSAEKLECWINKAGLSAVINKQSTTWRNLDEVQQKKLSNKKEAIKILGMHPAMIKRPVIENGDQVSFGLSDERLNKLA